MPMSLKNGSGTAQQIGKVHYKGANGVVAEISKVFWKDSVGVVSEVYSGSAKFIVGGYSKTQSGCFVFIWKDGEVLKEKQLNTIYECQVGYVNVNPISELIFVSVYSTGPTLTTYVLNYNLDIIATHNNISVLSINKGHLISEHRENNLTKILVRSYSGSSIGGTVYAPPQSSAQPFFDQFNHLLCTRGAGSNVTLNLLNINGSLINSVVTGNVGIEWTTYIFGDSGIISRESYTTIASFATQRTLSMLKTTSLQGNSELHGFNDLMYIPKTQKGYVHVGNGIIREYDTEYIVNPRVSSITYANMGASHADGTIYAGGGKVISMYNSKFQFQKSVTAPAYVEIIGDRSRSIALNYSPKFK